MEADHELFNCSLWRGGVELRRYNIHVPLPLYSIMMMRWKDDHDDDGGGGYGDDDGVWTAERFGVGAMHIHAFLREGLQGGGFWARMSSVIGGEGGGEIGSEELGMRGVCNDD